QAEVDDGEHQQREQNGDDAELHHRLASFTRAQHQTGPQRSTDGRISDRYTPEAIATAYGAVAPLRVGARRWISISSKATNRRRLTSRTTTDMAPPTRAPYTPAETSACGPIIATIVGSSLTAHGPRALF